MKHLFFLFFLVFAPLLYLQKQVICIALIGTSSTEIKTNELCDYKDGLKCKILKNNVEKTK